MFISSSSSWTLETTGLGLNLCPCVTLGESFGLFEPWFLQLHNGGDRSLHRVASRSEGSHPRAWHSGGQSQDQCLPSTCRSLSCCLRGSPQEEGNPFGYQPCADGFLSLLLGSLRTRRGSAHPFFVLWSDTQSVFTRLVPSPGWN